MRHLLRFGFKWTCFQKQAALAASSARASFFWSYDDMQISELQNHQQNYKRHRRIQDSPSVMARYYPANEEQTRCCAPG